MNGFSVVSFGRIPLLIVAMLMSSGGAQDFGSVEKQAHEAREAGRLKEAIQLYRQGLEQNPSWSEGWWYLGTILYELDQYQEARDAFRKFLATDRESGPAWALRGLCEYQTREYEQALASLKQSRMLGLGGNKQLTYVASYHLALLLNRYEEFEQSFSILFLLARDQSSPKIDEALGISVLRLPYLPLELPPDRRERVLLAGKAASYSASFRAEVAKQKYEELVERYPQERNVHYAFGVFLLQDNPDRAIAEFKRELEISPLHVPARLQIAFEYIRRGVPQEGLGPAREAVELAPSFFAVRNALGRVLLETGAIEEAIKELEKAVELAPDSPETFFALARAYTRAGRKEDAEQAREKFLRLNSVARTRLEGPQSVGGIRPETGDNPPKKEQ